MSTISVLDLASHTNPYSHYRWHLSQADLRFDVTSQCWIAAKAEVVQGILNSHQFLVRPASSKVPSNIVGSSAGEVFSYLIRMNEGSEHALGKRVLQTNLQQLGEASFDQAVLDVLHSFSQIYTLKKLDDINLWLNHFSVSVMARLCGFPVSDLVQVSLWIDDFVKCLSALSTKEQLRGASIAAECLLDSFQALLNSAQASSESFLNRLQEEAKEHGWESSRALRSNLIGLLSQTYEASSGLIANSLIAMHQYPKLREELHQDRAQLSAFIGEVARWDPSVQNTRRFVAEDCELAGVRLRAGDTILLLLAAANRDPNANPEAEKFDLRRHSPRLMSFSHGRHQCPGQDLAYRMSWAALNHLLDRVNEDFWINLNWQYRPSANGRLPVFLTPSQEQ